MAKTEISSSDTLLRRLLPFDHLVLVYCWIILILVINFVRPLGAYADVLAFHAGMIVLVVMLAYFVRSEESAFLTFLRLLYPALALTFFYSACGRLVGTVVPVFYDHQIVSFERTIFGINPTLWLDRRLDLFLNELMSFGYFSYYLMILGLPLALFFGRKYREIKSFVTATCATFFISYIVFIFYPVAGPRFFLAPLYNQEITGPLFRRLVNLVIDNAAFEGGAMPSSHVAEAIVVMYYAIRVYGRKAWFMVPLVIILGLGTVYGRFHYVSDVVAGIALGVIVTWLTVKFYPPDKEPVREARITDADILDRYVSHHS